MVFQRAVRVSQRLQSRSLQSRESQTFGLVQIVLEASKNRGVSQTLGRQSLYIALARSQRVLTTMETGITVERIDNTIYKM